MRLKDHLLRRIGRLASWTLSRLHRVHYPSPLTRLGTQYGGWYCDTAALEPEGICICAGAGEDISFDVALNALYEQRVVCIDPTPRAVAHVRSVLDRAGSPNGGSIDGGSETYDLTRFDPTRFVFLDVALWNCDTTLRLYAPKNPDHVSHSALNIQGTSEYIEVRARTLESLDLPKTGREPSLLKLDIEGAEYAAIESMIRSTLRPRQLLIEFDELHHPRSLASIRRVARTVRELKAIGYELARVERANFVFMRRS